MAFRTANPRPFGPSADIAGELGRGFAQVGAPAATLIKHTPRERATGDLAGGTRATQTEIPCRGIPPSEASEPGKVTSTIKLLGATILYQGARVVPESGDRVAIDGVTYAIVDVKRDPAGAVYTLTCTAAGPGIKP